MALMDEGVWPGQIYLGGAGPVTPVLRFAAARAAVTLVAESGGTANLEAAIFPHPF